MPDPVHALEARIRANPDDGEAWKVYADWLLDHGDRRGELIMLDSLAATTSDPKLRTSIAALNAEQRASWTPSGLSADACVWRSGFVTGATVRVAGRHDVGTLGRVLADPQARLLTHLRLDFDDSIKPKDIARLSELELGQLRSLRSIYHRRGDALVRGLAKQPDMNLTTLDLRHCGLTNNGLVELAGCEPLVRGLRKLHLQHNGFAAKGVQALASAPGLRELELLDLRYNAIGEAGALALADSPVLGKLTTLLLYASDTDQSGIRALASSTTLPHDLVRFWRAQDPLS